jgi:hypothetical protein
VTARGTDWSLALLVSLLFASGLGTWLAGDEGDAWVIATHGIAGGSLAILLVWKLRRVWRRLVRPESWDGRTGLGAAALTLVASTLASGWLWVTAGAIFLAGFSLLAWHALLGGLLMAVVVVHLAARGRAPRRADFGRRQLLQGAAIGAGGFLAWSLQGTLNTALGLPGERRRFTGSYEDSSFQGNLFPTTSWVADDPARLDPGAYGLEVAGELESPLRLTVDELDAGDELTATLDCTGGFYSTQEWRGTRAATLIDRAGPTSDAAYLRVISTTGYRWSFGLDDAGELLLATHVGGEPLSHGHGSPLRLVAPGRRGFQWVKWVVRLELAADPDYGAVPSTIWSSFTARGRGSA